TPPFSFRGDSGAIVLTREGGILGMVHGGAISSKHTGFDVVYVIPFWFIMEQIRKV
ncbi:hypothetical protein EV361DRAFT_777739, partial [Lentinula raphanica]